jgi:hypothetical protein
VDEHPFASMQPVHRKAPRAAAAWFDVWLRVFLAGVVGALVVVAVGPLLQITVIGAGTLIAALLGAGVCAVGLATYDPARWRELQAHVTGVGESLHGAAQAIGEPRAMAHARIPRDS